MKKTAFQTLLFGLLPALAVTMPAALGRLAQDSVPAAPSSAADTAAAPAPRVQYLEIVTPEVKATCEALEKLHGVTFGDPVAVFGNARTASLHGGGLVGVRGPLRPDETPVVRPYMLVEDIESKVQAAKEAGAEIAIPAMEVPDGRGKFAIYILGGIEHGLWEL